MDYIKQKFSEVVFFNLLGIKRGEEHSLTTYLVKIMKLIEKDEMKGVFYEHADFHAIVKETDFSAINRFINGILNE